MGTNSLAKIAASPAKIPATSTQYNDVVDALQGHIVMRDSSGVIEDNVSEIGRPSSGRPKKVHVGESITVGGQTLNTTPFLLSRTGITSGAAKASGYPQYLEPGDQTGAGGGSYVRILGAATSLEMTIDGTAYTLEADLVSDDLALAPGSNNTCLVNDALIAADPNWSKTIGEFGFYINVDAIGSEIDSLNGTIQCFKISNGSQTEVFIAEVEVDNTGTEKNKLIPILRGIGETKRIAFTDNDTITLLKAHYVFLDNDLTTISTTTNYPTWSATEPSAPASGDYWWDVANKTWKRYSGSTWETLGRIYLGYAIADSTGVLWAEPADYELSWDSLNEFVEIEATTTTQIKISRSLNISVAGETIRIDEYQKLLDIDSDMIAGEVKIVGWHYIYVDKTGGIKISHQAPRTIGNKRGYYHPNEYMRAIGAVYNNAANELELTTYNHIDGTIINTESGTTFQLAIADFGDGSGVYAKVIAPEMLPMVRRATLAFVLPHATNATVGNIQVRRIDATGNEYRFTGFAVQDSVASAIDTNLCYHSQIAAPVFQNCVFEGNKYNATCSLIYILEQFVRF